MLTEEGQVLQTSERNQNQGHLDLLGEGAQNQITISNFQHRQLS